MKRVVEDSFERGDFVSEGDEADRLLFLLSLIGSSNGSFRGGSEVGEDEKDQDSFLFLLPITPNQNELLGPRKYSHLSILQDGRSQRKFSRFLAVPLLLFSLNSLLRSIEQGLLLSLTE